MPRRRSRGRVPNGNANYVAPSLSDFDENWLRQYQERQYSRLVDLTNLEDRRRWHPNNLNNLPGGPAPFGLTRPRVVIVPEGHRLARLAPYGGRVPLYKALNQADRRTRRRSLEEAVQYENVEPRGRRYQSLKGGHLSRRVGFQHPWQVMICIRRKRRKEVLHAFKKTGGRGGAQKRPRRNYWSEVRC